MGEFQLIERLAPFLAGAGDDVPVGHGDDAAVIEVDGRWVCVTVDVLVDGVHFRPDVSSMADVGWKSVAVGVSDIAAMGARTTAAVVGLARPGSLPESRVEELYAGMHAACRRWGVRLVGGD
ncbi:MAG: AIR synthase related protein, partial [Actinomycetota bacterium]|nr:AIR synthase related protein [Actinomycetota bacterium]